MVGAGDVDYLDPALAYHTVTRGILRACTRQLVSYASGSDYLGAGLIVADMATEVPTRENGRLSADGRTYTFTIKPGVAWDAPAGPRQVQAGDVARGIKRLAHPLAPSPALSYFLSTIEGMAEFRDGLAGTDRSVTELADRIETRDIWGIRVLDEATLEFTTRFPTSDFLNILAMSFATPAPREYLRFRPGAAELQQNLMAVGPYRITSYLPGRELVLDRNQAWQQDTDDVRAAYLDGVRVRQGVPEDEAHELVAAGAADMLWDIQPLTERLPDLLAAEDPRLEVCPAGLLSPYLAFNFLSPNGSHATSKLGVRQAVQFAIDKRSVSQVWGGPRLNDIAHQILPPLCSAHREFIPYPSPGGAGDPERARKLLAEAGYPDGVRLKMIYRDRDIHPESARRIRAGLARAGIELDLLPVSIGELFTRYFATAEPARRGDWDIAYSGWEPDWYGNNARTYLQPLFDSSDVSASDDWSSNIGRYRSAVVNELIREALTSSREDRASEFFRLAETQIMQDAAIVPVLFAHQYWFHSARVRNWLPYPVLNGDLTNLWLEPAKAADACPAR
jgi:peptide/nickel transport system substrate-binding protein